MRRKTRPAVEFAEAFIKHGHRYVEHMFGHRSEINTLFRKLCGGTELTAKRRECRRGK